MRAGNAMGRFQGRIVGTSLATDEGSWEAGSGDGKNFRLTDQTQNMKLMSRMSQVSHFSRETGRNGNSWKISNDLSEQMLCKFLFAFEWLVTRQCNVYKC